MKSRLTIYKLGLRRAETHGNQDEITTVSYTHLTLPTNSRV